MYIKKITNTTVLSLLSLLLLCFLSSCTSIPKPDTATLSHKTITPFESEQAFISYLNRIKQLNDYRNKKQQQEKTGLNHVVVTGSQINKQPSITNNQVSGIDEGDIVKLSNNHLLILRQGKLFSVALKQNSQNVLKPISQIAVPPSYWKYDSWYDEMLVLDDVILVLAFNYDLDVSEIHRFTLSSAGQLNRKDSFIIRSDDYWNFENYASRLYQGRYINYLPIKLTRLTSTTTIEDIKKQLPKIAQITHGNIDKLSWKNLVAIENIQQPLQALVRPTLHTLLNCDPLSDDFSCSAKVILGSSESMHYVSHDAIYLWIHAWQPELLLNHSISDSDTLIHEMNYNSVKPADSHTLVYRITFAEKPVTAMQVFGEPSNQFSFHEYQDNLYIALLDHINKQDIMSSSLYKLPVKQFNQSASHTAEKIASLLPTSEYYLNNRFINKFLLSGHYTSFDWEKKQIIPNINKNLSVVDIETGEQTTIPLTHAADRIEPIHQGAFVMGFNKAANLVMTSLSIETDVVEKHTSETFTDIVEVESRSHAFNNKKINSNSELIGFTTLNKSDSKNPDDHFDWDWGDDMFNKPSNLFFVYLDKFNGFSYAGTLKSQAKSLTIENCDSCDDWYGNTRPFFINDRIFGLSGDELIEAQLTNNELFELQRINIKSVEKN